MIRFLQTPGPLKKIILGGLLLIICAAMVITLVPGGLGSSFGFGGPGQGVLATVAGLDVTTAEVQRQARLMLRQQFPKGSSMAAQLLPFFASRAAEELITQKAVLAEADRLGLHVSDEELRDELQHGQYASAFFPGGTFIGTDAYEARIEQADLTVPQFEEGVKDDILFDKLRQLVAGSAFVTDEEVHREFIQRNTKVKFDYAVLNKDDIAKGIHPTDTELKAYYDSHQASYKNSIPEKRKVAYVLIDTAKLQAQATVTPADLQAYYDQHRDEYRAPEQVNVRQILIKTPLPGPDGKVDQKAVDEAHAKAEEALKELKAGAKFEDLAKKYSEDPSAKNGGSIGWVKRGSFPVPEVDNAAFSLPKGGTSGVINAGYAFVILHVDDRQSAHLKTLDEVKDQIGPLIRREKATHAADTAAANLLNQARSQGLDKAAVASGMQVVTTDFVSRSDALPGIGPSPEFMDAVFNEREDSPPDEVQLRQGYAIFRVLAVKPPSTPTFEEIRSQVETQFRNERSSALLTQKTQELSDRAKAEHDLKKAARELGAIMKTSDFVLPSGQVPDIGSMSGAASEVFSMKPGEISGPIDNGNNGVVVALLDKQEPSPQDFAAQKDQIRDSLLQNKRAELFNLFVANLRDQMQKAGKIKINQEEMKALTRSQAGEEGE
jgi:peptidyl-prolyl cis-trans isomerase D